MRQWSMCDAGIYEVCHRQERDDESGTKGTGVCQSGEDKKEVDGVTAETVCKDQWKDDWSCEVLEVTVLC